MLLIDRYILARFIANFVILFALLFVFAATIDLILNLDKFIDAARLSTGEAAGSIAVTIAFIRVVADFELPRVFQFYAYLHGIVAIGAMGFTLAQMHRFKELVALLASGMSLYRVALPFFFAVFLLSLVQLLNQEIILPKVAPLLLRGHSQIGQPSIREFEVMLTPDAKGNLLQSPSFDPVQNVLDSPTIIERDARGLTARRVTARRAQWDSGAGGWRLDDGRAMKPPLDGAQDGGASVLEEPVEVYRTDLDPRVLTVNRYRQFAGMLSLSQISEMLSSRGAVDVRALLRHRYTRFASVLVNLLVLGLTLPCFLLREPANLLRQSLLCAVLAIPAMLGAAIGMMVDLPGIPPAAGVFMPVIILIFIAFVPWTNFRT